MCASVYCEKCGDLMEDDMINRKDFKESTHHFCSKCGFNYESGFRYNALTKQYVRYLRFDP